jgi:chitin disaccharide deacetylase
VLTVIVNADDFGLAEGINRSVVACHDAGSVTSATLLVNMQATEHAAAYAGERPALGVGVHFNLTQGTPVEAPDRIPSLVSGRGVFHDRATLLRRSLLGLIRQQDVVRELNAQLSRAHALGVTPTHLDSHQHVHALLPVVFGVLSAEALSRNIPLRVPWPWKGAPIRRTLVRQMKRSVLATMLRWSTRSRQKHLQTNDHFCSVFDLGIAADELTNDSYRYLLAPYATGVVELMVHPGEVDEEAKILTQISDIAAAENLLLRSGGLRLWVEARGGRFGNYRDALM